MSKYHFINLYPVGREAVITELTAAHIFKLGEIVKYVRSVSKVNGMEHLFENVEGRGDFLVDGEFELLPEKKKYAVSLDGCDDSTMFNLTMTEEEAKFLKRVAEITHQVSSYSCMPKMEISDKPHSTLYNEGDEF